MKISKLFHWLYFMVMMLPLFVVPIYFIYSQRHDLTEQTEVDIQYKYQSNDVQSVDDLIDNNIYYFDYSINIVNDEDFNFDLYILGGYVEFESTGFSYVVDNIDVTQPLKISISSTTSVFMYDVGLEPDSLYIEFNVLQCSDYSQFLTYLQLIDDSVDYTIFSQSDFNIIESVQVEDTNISITNAFVNSFADTIDKYFNYDNVVDFGSLYGWLNSTFFNNQAPLGFFIFWHLLEYWLLTSLLWVLFDVLLYVPNLIHRWLDKASLN